MKVFDYTVGAEVSSNTFYHSVPEDRLARQYVAGLINASGFANHTITENDVVALSAMESLAWMNAVERWTKKTGEIIPVAIVRSVSNYDHTPLDLYGQPITEEDGTPLTAMEDILVNFQNSGASTAAENAALPVLKMLELRHGTTRNT